MERKEEKIVSTEMVSQKRYTFEKQKKIGFLWLDVGAAPNFYEVADDEMAWGSADDRESGLYWEEHGIESY
ncbi:MAG TPA: hypothetical protein EYP29_04930 [Thermoplasmata archaeon]|nr:hypothetical protein [Thermoplasmata archaeon]